MDAILGLAGKAIGIILDAIARRGDDVEASRVRLVDAVHELCNGLRDLDAVEKASHDRAVKRMVEGA